MLPGLGWFSIGKGELGICRNIRQDCIGIAKVGLSRGFMTAPEALLRAGR